MAPRKIFRNKYIANAGHDSEWTPKIIGSRVGSNGGTYQSKINSHTTHLIVTAKMWKAQHPMVKEALELNLQRSEDRKIRIVSFDWLDDSWRNGLKHEGVYEWERLDPKRAGGSKKADKKTKGQQTEEADGPKSHVGMMTEVLQESTDKFMSAREKKQLEQDIKVQRRAREMAEKAEYEERQAEEKIKEQSLLHKRGAKKARNDAFTDNHHIYMDDTAFKYDILLTKVDTKHNRNIRWALTIYESNSMPYTYAVNIQFAGTGKETKNHILCPVGTPFPTALRVFKLAFKEKTKVDWDSRISFSYERSKREKRARGQGTGSEAGTQKGVPVSESVVAKSGSANDEDFATAPFAYHPPAYGPRGIISDDERARVAEIGMQPGSSTTNGLVTEHPKVEHWISGGDGSASEVTQNGLPDDSRVDLTEADDNDEVFVASLDRILGVNNTGNNSNTGEAQVSGQTEALAEAIEYPFINDGAYEADVATDQNETTQGISFDTFGAMQDSFEPGTQVISETQVAERVQGEFTEYLNLPADGEGPSPPTLHKPDLGKSILGKRKQSPAEEDESEESKKRKLAEVDDSFGEESYTLGTDHGGGGESGIPRLFTAEMGEAATDATPVENVVEFGEGVNAD